MMADERTARPVSGEIMTGPALGAAERPARGPAGDIVEAEYKVLPAFACDAERVKPASARISPSAPPNPVPSLEGMGMLRKPGIPASRPASRGGPIFWIAGVGAALAAFWVSGGHALVRQAPLFAAGQAGVALSISGVTSRIDATGPKPVLFVDGEAANDGTRPAQPPPLEISVTGNDGRVTRYRLGTSGRELAPGQRFAFSSRLDLPRNGVRTVSVAFAE
jgi:hypothetical protein